MFKNSFENQNLQTLAANAIPLVTVLLIRFISPIWQAFVENAPGKNSPLLLPSGPQSTAYLVSHPQRHR
jgi:hypothetical protein